MSQISIFEGRRKQKTKKKQQIILKRNTSLHPPQKKDARLMKNPDIDKFNDS